MRDLVYTALLRWHLRAACRGHVRIARALHRALAIVHAPRGAK